MSSRFRRLLPALFLLLPYAAPAFADEAPPDAAALREHVRAAAAVPKAFRRTTVTTSSDGMTTTVRYVERGDDWREIRERGPFHLGAGTVLSAHAFKGPAPILPLYPKLQ